MSLGPVMLLGVVTWVNSDGSDHKLPKMAVRFKVPGVWENMTKYPVAYPVGGHNYPTKVNDTILVTRIQSSTDDFYYQPLDFEQFIGIKNADSKIEAKEKTINISSGTINILPTEELCIKLNGSEFIKIKNNQIDFVGGGELNPLLNQAFTCKNCFMTGAPHGTNSLKKVI